MSGLHEKNNIYKSSFLDKIKEQHQEEKTAEDERTFPLFKSKDSFESFVVDINEKKEELKNSFYELGYIKSDLTTSERNKIIDDIILNIDKVESLFDGLRNELEADKNTVKGLSLINRNNLKEFDSIFNSWE
ncbi:hypothetical protein [Staphylococcus succinus]|uniref:hypothetical protein n=1 Tax=Staphylococcus succinus TaxID=61015 RepID=UPI000E6A87CD|nr:hypothetical protein [Staphylococcus succinus]RIN27707.1 hypothetical protein BU067_01490 [Staphylococcus succinus]